MSASVVHVRSVFNEGSGPGQAGGNFGGEWPRPLGLRRRRLEEVPGKGSLDGETGSLRPRRALDDLEGSKEPSFFSRHFRVIRDEWESRADAQHCQNNLQKEEELVRKEAGRKDMATKITAATVIRMMKMLKDQTSQTRLQQQQQLFGRMLRVIKQGSS